jgi:CHAT domain-containing protein
LAFLPLHAAGIYGESDSESILDYAVSSYTPTITSLTDRVKHHSAINADVSGLFLTCQPNAPNAKAIPGTIQEVTSIYDQVVKHGARAQKVEGSNLTVEESLGYMESFSSIHLACHASQDHREPLKSGFLFHDGPLTLSNVMQKNLKNADLAYLSAGQTSTGDEKLSEEAVHLAAGMLAAGYCRVVATMWAIEDGHATEVAKDFYDYLLAHQCGDAFDGSQSAYALNYATQKLRQRLDNSSESLLAWMPYVHYGL